MRERSIRAVSKTVDPQGSGGSNPPLSVLLLCGDSKRRLRRAARGRAHTMCAAVAGGGSDGAYTTYATGDRIPLSPFYFQQERKSRNIARNQVFSANFEKLPHGSLFFQTLERCPSGLRYNLGKVAYRKVPGVRIPFSPYSSPAGDSKRRSRRARRGRAHTMCASATAGGA